MGVACSGHSRNDRTAAQVCLTPRVTGIPPPPTVGHFACNVQCSYLGPFGVGVWGSHVTLGGP